MESVILVLLLDEERKTAIDVVRRVRQSLRVPLTVGGGISSLSDAHSLLMAGADKVSGLMILRSKFITDIDMSYISR